MPTVYEGSAELNIKQFLEQLDALEAAVTKAATDIGQAFQNLDQKISQSLGGSQALLAAVSQQISGIGALLSGANTAANQTQQLSQATAAAQANTTKSTQEGADAAIKLAQAQARGAASAGDYAKAEQILTEALQKNSGSALLAQNAQNQLDEVQRKRVAAGQQALQDQARLDQQAERQVEQSANARAEAIAIEAEKEQRTREQAARDALQAARSANQSLLDELRTANQARAREIQAQAQREIEILTAAREKARQQQLSLLDQQAGAKEQQANALAVGDPKGAKAAEQAYQRAVQAAREAEEEEARLEQQLTQTMQVERQAQSRAALQADREQVESGRQARRDFQEGWSGAVSQAMEDARRNIKQVEDSWNSIFRAGSQLSSVGTQMSVIAGSITGLGYALTNSAGDFDFWSRRVVASAQAANSDLFDVFGGQKQTLQAFNNSILELGRDLGTLKPEEVAQSWYLYQSAVGEAITTTDQLQVHMEGVRSVLQAAIISDTDYATSIRGVTQAMAEFGIGAEGMSHATAVMLNLTQTSQAEFSDVIEAFKMVGPQAHALGMSLEEVSAMMARLSDYGIRGSAAGRALAVGLSTILDPSDKADAALQHLFITSQGLTGKWQELIFAGGHFVGFLDTLNASGETVTKGFLHQFADATKGMTEAQRESYLAMIFTQNATRALIPLVKEYTDAQNSGAAATETGKKRMEEMEREFANVTKQASLFNSQWELVSQSIKVRLGQALYGLQEAAVRLGYVVADTFVPIVEWVTKAVNAFLQWGESHPAIAQGIISIAAGIGVLMAVGGPLLIFLGSLLKTIATLPIIWSVLTESMGVVGVALGGVGTAIGAVLGPIAALAAAVGLLYLTWKNNWFGMQEALTPFVTFLQTELTVVMELLDGAFRFIEGLLSGNKEMMRQAAYDIVVAFVEAFYVLPQRIYESLAGVGQVLSDWASTTFGSMEDGLLVWGENLMISLANGIVEGAQAVWTAVEGVAEGIAQFFRSYSPPKHGPLTGIYVWGRNLIGTFIEGMNAADVDAVSDITDRIGTALQNNIKYGDGNAANYASTMMEANTLAAQMVGIVQAGGRVNEDFFASLKDGLGGWYDDVVRITLAYQNVYAAQRALDIEKDKLKVIQEQRKELEAQNKAREDAFDRILKGTNPATDINNPTVAAQMVDPTTDEGKAKIEEMRRKLSKEDFQNWINWQKELWSQKQDAEDQALKTQEDATQTTIDAYQQQLDLVKQQYDYYTKIAAYAERMAELQEEQDRLLKAQEEKVKQPPLYGTPEQLQQYAEEIRKVTGADKAIADEGQLRDNRGGDDIGALGDATRQREAEQGRIDALEKLNRQKRAEFETQLINAKSEDERRTIKEQKDAWDAAYKDEKQRLQERLQFTKDIEEAAKKQADASEPGRIAQQRLSFEQQIKALIGDQTASILDANQLKANSKDLDEAQVKAREQMRTEERELRDLQAAGDQKKLEFEQRIKEAGNDPEKVRRIKEEQDAWELAYKKAVEAQQARVEAARRAQQDLGDEAFANQKEKEPKGPKGPKPFEPPGIPGGGGFGGIDIPEPTVPKPPPTGPQQSPVPPVPRETRETYQDAAEKVGTLVRIYNILTTSSVSWHTRLQVLGQVIGKEIVGPFADWALKTTGLDKVLNDLRPSLDGVWQNLNKVGGPIDALKKGWTEFTTDLGLNNLSLKDVFSSLNDLLGSFEKGNGILGFVANIWNTVLKPAISGVWAFVKEDLIPLLGELMGTTFQLLGFALSKLGELWKDVLLPAIKLVWDFIDTAITPIFNTLVTVGIAVLKGALEFLAATWNNVLLPALKLTWQFIKEDLAPLLALLVETGITVLKLAVSSLADTWSTYLKPAIEAVYKFINESLFPKLKEFADWIGTTLKPAGDTAASAFSAIQNAISSAITKIGDFINGIRDALRAWNDWLGRKNDSDHGAGGKVEGSFAKGLDYVPKDGFVAELHKGERVLTAAEASIYNRVERLGVLGVLDSLAASATAAVSAATQPGRAQVANTTTNQRQVNIGTLHVSEANPDEGLELVNRLAFLT